MKSKNNVFRAFLSKQFSSGSVLKESRIYCTEVVTPGPLIRNDPIYRKAAASWSYTVNNTIALDDSESEVEWCYKQTEAVQNGQTIVKASGNSGIMIPDPSPSDYDYTGVTNLALGRLNDSVRGNLDISIALAEAGKTAQMIKRVGKVLAYARKVRPRGGFRIPKPMQLTSDVSAALANGYLEFKYGWKPLLSDVFAIADESIRFTMNQMQKFQASAKLPAFGSKIFLTSFDGISNLPVRLRWPPEDGRKAFLGAKYKIVLEIPDSSFDIARWSSLNPLSIGWELIPYSFVVDWFLDVGSYLRNIETACYYNTQFRSGFLSQIAVLPMEAFVDYYERISPPYRYECQGLKGYKYFLTFRRTPLTRYPTPSLPRFEVDLGASQLTSAAALLRQLLRRV